MKKPPAPNLHAALLLMYRQPAYRNALKPDQQEGEVASAPEVAPLVDLFRNYGVPIYPILESTAPGDTHPAAYECDSTSFDSTTDKELSDASLESSEIKTEKEETNLAASFQLGEVTASGREELTHSPSGPTFALSTLLANVFRESGVHHLFVTGNNTASVVRSVIESALCHGYDVSIVPETLTGVADSELFELSHLGVHPIHGISLADLFLSAGVKIIDFRPAYRQAFHDLNKAWLNRYFQVEPIDEYVLSQPEDAILHEGGKVFFALKDGTPVGTAALMHLDASRVELTKMAVDASCQGLGIGQGLCQQAIQVARQLGYRELVLFSHTRLESALHIYRKLGFKNAELDSTKYKRANVMMTYALLAD
jgi:ribosomal protein S18 acetylase RimI-like enzyme/nicotinamidase-related amidase